MNWLLKRLCTTGRRKQQSQLLGRTQHGPQDMQQKRLPWLGCFLRALCDVSSKSFWKGFCDWDQGLARQLAPYSAKVCLQLIVVTRDMPNVSLLQLHECKKIPSKMVVAPPSIKTLMAKESFIVVWQMGFHIDCYQNWIDSSTKIKIANKNFLYLSSRWYGNQHPLNLAIVNLHTFYLSQTPQTVSV